MLNCDSRFEIENTRLGTVMACTLRRRIKNLKTPEGGSTQPGIRPVYWLSFDVVENGGMFSSPVAVYTSYGEGVVLILGADPVSSEPLGRLKKVLRFIFDSPVNKIPLKVEDTRCLYWGFNSVNADRKVMHDLILPLLSTAKHLWSK